MPFDENRGKGRGKKVEAPRKTKANNSTSDVSNYYKNNDRILFDEMPFPDIYFDVNGTRVPAHRGMIVSRCPPFAKIFEGTTTISNNHQTVVQIENIEASTLKSFLEYIYCEECKIENEKSALDLFELAKTNSLPNLATLAEKYILENISTDNVVKVTTLADKYSHIQLLEAACRFLAQNFDQLFQDENSPYKLSGLSKNTFIKLFHEKKRPNHVKPSIEQHSTNIKFRRDNPFL